MVFDVFPDKDVRMSIILWRCGNEKWTLSCNSVIAETLINAFEIINIMLTCSVIVLIIHFNKIYLLIISAILLYGGASKVFVLQWCMQWRIIFVWVCVTQFTCFFVSEKTSETLNFHDLFWKYTTRNIQKRRF